MVEAIKVGCESDLSRNQLLQFIFDAIALYPAAVADPNKICTRCNKDIVTTFFTFINNNDLALQILKSLEINDDILNKIKSSIAIFIYVYIK
ncbi:hypothetical protein RirG_086190 [Rhizophagus irregularis DAOM 197198w]|uniref:Uncharacterized protein n=1 Tax=Rhizophagus irregularis (strain DAOM 197198w) TaxID=1432141 RepID=A0A015LDF9_RHIIW|nr:hypothetical protein RirG_086190 [Rhizophagus irregularis DAOM 197198w]